MPIAHQVFDLVEPPTGAKRCNTRTGRGSFSNSPVRTSDGSVATC